MSKETAVVKKCAFLLNNLGYDRLETIERSKELLKMYTDIVWLNSVSDTVNLNAFISKNKSNETKIDKLINTVITSQAFESIIENVMNKVKLYPVSGEIYYTIINSQYLSDDPKTEKELLSVFNVERSAFQHRKREALYIFAVSLITTLPLEIVC